MAFFHFSSDCHTQLKMLAPSVMCKQQNIPPLFDKKWRFHNQKLNWYTGIEPKFLWDTGTVVVTFNFGDKIPKGNYS